MEENEGAVGGDGATLDEFQLRLAEHLQTLQRDLRDRLYAPQPLLRAFTPMAEGGQRRLAIPTVRDRVAQSAAALVITPILEREFEASSFGFRHGRSVPHAVAAVRRHYDEEFRWVVDADIDNEVEHGLLLARLKEPRVRRSCRGAGPPGAANTRRTVPRVSGRSPDSSRKSMPRGEGIETPQIRVGMPRYDVEPVSPDAREADARQVTGRKVR